jgi:hypothetical protein
MGEGCGVNLGFAAVDFSVLLNATMGAQKNEEREKTRQENTCSKNKRK